MTVAVDDTDHRRWRETVEDLVDEWRDATIDLRDDAPADEPDRGPRRLRRLVRVRRR